MKKTIITLTFLMILFTSSFLFAKTYYYVYKKKGSNKCEITMRDPDAFKRAKGSSWGLVGKDTTRSGAKKIAEKNGCK